MGLHHLCLRARSRANVDRCAAVLTGMNATIIHGPEEGSWAPGYYSVLFEDQTASASNCALSRVPACWPRASRLTQLPAILNSG